MALSIVKSAAKNAGNLLVEEGKFLYNVRGRIESLQMELEWMECFLEDADSREYREKLVSKWVAQIATFANEAEDITNKYLLEGLYRDNGIWSTAKWFSKLICTCHCYRLHCLGSEIDDLTNKISELNSRLTRYGVKFVSPTKSLSYTAMLRENIGTDSSLPVVGLERDIQDVVDKLTQTQVKVVSICGTRGMGKSTLAKKVFGEKAFKKHFRNNCVWINISKKFRRRNVFEEILSGLILSAKDVNGRRMINLLTDGELLEKIHELLQKKECLVVLDGIRTNEDWDELKQALGSIETYRSKILLTTHNDGLLQHVDSNGYSHPSLEPLSCSDSMILLRRKVFGVRSEVEDDKTKMFNHFVLRCCGLPSAIIALGAILAKKKTLREWKEVLDNISLYFMTNDVDWSDGGGPLPLLLELSYLELPFYLKPYFLYFANFPENYEISTESLYQLWEAEGILVEPFAHKSKVLAPTQCFEVGERCLLELIKRSMVQVEKRWPKGRIKSVRLHKFMRDMCIEKAKEISFSHAQEVSNFDLQSVIGDCSAKGKLKMRRYAVHADRCFFDSRVYSGLGKQSSPLKTLLVFLLEKSDVGSGIKGFRKMAKWFPLLQVLDIQDTFAEVVPEIGHLKYLKYLNLRNFFLEKVPSSIWDLKHLLTLDLRSGYRLNLPNKFHLMERMKHLYLPKVFEVEGGQRLKFRVQLMETLKNFDPQRCEMKDLSDMNGLKIFSVIGNYCFESANDLELLLGIPVIRSCVKLVNSLHLHVRAEVIDENPIIFKPFQYSSSITKLWLEGSSGQVTECHKMERAIGGGIEVLFPHSLEQVSIKGCKLGREVISALENLLGLKMLRLLYVHMGNKITFSAKSFASLNYLFLCHIEELEEWEVGNGALPNLQGLQLEGCKKLKKLPEGLPDSVNIECEDPCINGNENHMTCPYFLFGINWVSGYQSEPTYPTCPYFKPPEAAGCSGSN